MNLKNNQKIDKREKKEPENCWDFWNCPRETREKCPAYQSNFGRECWLIAQNFCTQRKDGAKPCIEHCWECPWFKKLSPDFNKPR